MSTAHTGFKAVNIATPGNVDDRSSTNLNHKPDALGSHLQKGRPGQYAANKEERSLAQQSSGWFTRLKNCLHDVDKLPFVKYFLTAKDKEQPDDQQKAYKQLMEDLEGGPKEHSVFIMWLVNAFVLLLFIIFLVSTRSIHQIHNQSLLHMRIYTWVAFLMVIICGYPFICFATFVISEPIIWFRKNKRYAMFFARELKQSIDVTLWFALVLWVWYTWYRPEVVEDTRGARTLHVSVDEYRNAVKIAVKQITRLLLALTVGALIWVLKNALFLKLLASLHFVELCPRIRDTILDLHGIQFIETKGQWKFLSLKSENGQTNGSQNVKKNDRNSSSEGAGKGGDEQTMKFWICVSQLEKETAPIWILKRLSEMYMENMKKKKPPILKRMEAIHDDDKLMDEARKMLKKVTPGREDSDITDEDLLNLKLKKEEIEQIFMHFKSEGGETPKRITRDQFLRWAVLAVKKCLGLQSIIVSSQSVFFKLKVLMSSCVVVLVLVIWLLLSEIVTTAQMAILFAPFVSASFIFGESLKRTFNSLIFVFGQHPFDAGDRVIVETVEMKVTGMNILTTNFIKFDNGEETIYPNYELASKPIVNLDVRPDQSDSIEFPVPVDTPEELLADLQVTIKKTLDEDVTLTSDTTVAVKQITKDEITLVVHFKYLVSYLSSETKDGHRSKFLFMILKLRREMENTSTIIKEEDSSLEMVDVRFKIDEEMKLKEINEKFKNPFEESFQFQSGGLVVRSLVIFTGFTKDKKIEMVVRAWFRGTEGEKRKLVQQITSEIQNQGGEFEGMEKHGI